MPVGPGGGAEQDGLALERLGVKDVDEGLEEPAVGGAESGLTAIMPSEASTPAITSASFGAA